MRQRNQLARALVLSAVTALTLTANAQAADSILLFYHSFTGAATAGQVDANGNYTDLRDYPRFDLHWSRIVPTTDGLVLFYDGRTGKAATARFQADGSYQDLQNLKVPLSFDIAHEIVSTSDGILLSYGGPRGLETGRLDANGNYVHLLTYKAYTQNWSHIVPTHDGLVLFYDVVTRKVATGRVQPDGSFQFLNNYTNFDPWTHIVSTSDGILLFYNLSTGASGTGQVDVNGNYSDLRFFSLDRYWSRIVPTTNGLSLFYTYQAANGFGRVDAQGAFTDGPAVKDLDEWTHIVAVR